VQGLGLELQVLDLGQAPLKPYDSIYYGSSSQISYHIIPAVFAEDGIIVVVAAAIDSVDA